MLIHLRFRSKLQIRCDIGHARKSPAVAWSYPGDYGEEGEGDGGAGSVGALVKWHLLGRGPRPLIGQKAEAHKVKKSPET